MHFVYNKADAPKSIADAEQRACPECGGLGGHLDECSYGPPSFDLDADDEDADDED